MPTVHSSRLQSCYTYSGEHIQRQVGRRPDTPRRETTTTQVASASTPLVLSERCFSEQEGRAPQPIQRSVLSIFYVVPYTPTPTRHDSSGAHRGHSLRHHTGCRGMVLVGMRCHLRGATACPIALGHNRFLGVGRLLQERMTLSRLSQKRPLPLPLCDVLLHPCHDQLVWRALAKVDYGLCSN